jgi:hypothetical protein
MITLAIAALCTLAIAAFAVFVLALCKTAAAADKWMNDIVVEPADSGEYLGG